MPDPEALQDELDEFVGAHPRHDARLEYDNPPDFVPVPDLDDAYADRLLRRRGLLLRKAHRNRQLARQNFDAIAAWQARVNGSLESEVDRIDRLLAGYMRAVKARSNGKTKSLKLPNGMLGLRSPGKAKREVTDAAILVEWCQANDHPDWLATTVKPTIGHADLARGELISTRVAEGTTEHLFEAIDPSTGVRVPGVLLAVRTEDSFYVKPPADVDPDEEGGEDE